MNVKQILGRFKKSNPAVKETKEDKDAKRIAELEKAVRNKDSKIEKQRFELEQAKEMIDVYEEKRDDVRSVVKQSILNADKEAVLEAKKEALDAKAAQLREKESQINYQEEGSYKNGYADGVADGVRKINEITQKYRDGAMNVAMVAAASHTPVENMKEVNNALRITDGSQVE